MSLEKLKKNKQILNQIFFNYKVTTFTKAKVDEFWLFLEKYFEKLKQNASTSSNNQRFDSEKFSELIEKLSNKIPSEWKNIDNIQVEISKLNNSCKLSSCELQEFLNILLIFTDFYEKRKAKKLEKLLQFQKNLPIYEYKEEILNQIKSNSVILIAGDTGCGKSTQVPQYLLQNGFEKICCTQPRRIACIALCNRLSVETADEYSSEIGYQIRFEKSKTKFTKVLFLTEGLLLRQMIENPLLSNYQVIILDEIHERHLSSDFLLGAIKCLLHKRKNDLKVILMSATVNCDLFSKYFGNCHVIKVPGRLYPIKVEYFQPEKINVFKLNSSKINTDPYLKILQLIDSQHSTSERGDVLIFLSGFTEIETLGERLKNYADESKRWIILYLHSALPISEQDKVFDIVPEGIRKCILSTNIAETSITIDGIRFVIDSGKVKEMQYESKTRMNRLQEIWISKASAEQRKGRAGRTGPGVCFRLYSLNDYDNFIDFSKPEIQRVSLESLILNMISMGLNDVRKFPFIEPPDILDIETTLKCLINYGTLDEQERITYLGRILSKLPVNIPIGKMLIYSICINKHEYALSMAACLSVQSLITIRSKNNTEMVEERKSLVSNEGDLFSNLNFYKKWLSLKSGNQNTRLWCRKLGFEEQRFHEITKLRRQFEEILKDANLIDMDQSREEHKLTKSERIMKHGERKLYQILKEQVRTSKHKKRKLLKFDDNFCDNSEKEDKPDINWTFKETEFNLTFDSHYFSVNERKHILKENEFDLIKMIIILSFYPQLAIADLDNSYHLGSDQIFHTKDKPFVVLHPSSVYFYQPDLLMPAEFESLPIGNVSFRHNLLGYISFIETNKSYICNCYQISAVHMLLLTAQELDTDQECSRIVCDNWIEIQFFHSQDGQDMLILACKIREKISNFLMIIFNNLNDLQENEGDKKTLTNEDCKNLRRHLIDDIHCFMKCQVKYAIKRLLSADMKTIYTSIPIDNLEPFKNSKLISFLLKHFEKNNFSSKNSLKKGGFRFSFINYNCLKNLKTEFIPADNRRTFVCEKCKKSMYLSPIEQVRHVDLCKKISETQANLSEKATLDAKLQKYYCKHCDQDLMLNNVDILRHRNTHSR